MLGVEALPAIVYSFMLLRIPQSPRWLLINRGDEGAARAVISRMGIDDVEAAIQQIKASVKEVKESTFWNTRYSKPLLLAFLLAFFNQLSGINFVLYYAPEILEAAGLASSDSLFSSISIGMVNLVFTLLGMYLIDRAGRTQLMLWGSLGYILSLSMVAYAFYSSASSMFLLSFILVFIASHAIGQGAVIWVFISEIFPTKVRAMGQSFGSGVHWVFAALITLLTPVFLDQNHGIFKDNPWPIFAFFASFMILQLLFVLIIMPETKGKSLEQIESELVKP